MRITADTNLLIRAAVGDDPEQYQIAAKVLQDAEFIAVTTPVLCEFVWVLRRVYRFSRDDIAMAIERLISEPKVTADRDAVAAGLKLLKAGGDFADGVIAADGERLGADVFVSFDREAVRRLSDLGVAAMEPRGVSSRT